MKRILKGLTTLMICGALNFGLTTDAQAAELDSSIDMSGIESQEVARHHHYPPPGYGPPHRDGAWGHHYPPPHYGEYWHGSRRHRDYSPPHPPPPPPGHRHHPHDRW